MIKQAVKELFPDDSIDKKWNAFQLNRQEAFEAGVEFAQQWYDVNDELPETPIIEENIHYSEYLLIKVKGYSYPFIGYYVKANDDEFFSFIFKGIISQEDITHFRPIELK